MSNVLKVNVKVNYHKIRGRLTSLFKDEKLRTSIHNSLVRYCDPYVPMGDTGNLSQTVEVTPDYVRYTQPYAHYQYTGDVYGPNIPIMKGGQIVGWFSDAPKGGKYPTGAKINYSTEGHPLATKEWDKAMMRDRGKQFTKEVERLILARANELGN